MSSGSQPPSRTLVGFQQQYQYPRTATSSSHSRSSAASRPRKTDGGPLQTTAEEGPLRTTEFFGPTALPDTIGRPTTVKDSGIVEHYKPNIIGASTREDLSSNEAPQSVYHHVEDVHGNDELSKISQNQSLIVDQQFKARSPASRTYANYGFGKWKPCPSIERELMQQTRADAPSDATNVDKTLETFARQEIFPENDYADDEHQPRSGVAASSFSARVEEEAENDQQFAGASKSPRWSKNRRGYFDEQTDALPGQPSAPRDLQAKSPHQAAASGPEFDRFFDSGQDEEPSPLVFLDQMEEASAVASETKRRRGILLSSNRGRRRRSGSAGLFSSNSESGSTSSSRLISSISIKEEKPVLCEDDKFDDAIDPSAPDLYQGLQQSASDDRSVSEAGSKILYPRSGNADSTQASDPAETDAGNAEWLADSTQNFLNRASPCQRDVQYPETSKLGWAKLEATESMHAPLFAQTAPSEGSISHTDRSPSQEQRPDAQLVGQGPSKDASFQSAPTPLSPRRGRRGQVYATGVSLEPPPLPIRRRVAPCEGMNVMPATEIEQIASKAASSTSLDPQRQRQGQPQRRQQQKDWETHILRADWEELEVARFLNSFGKHVHEVRSTAPLAPGSFTQPHFPSKTDWITYASDGSAPSFNAVGYYLACVTALVSYMSPNQMVDLQRENGSTKSFDEVGDESDDEEESMLREEFRLQSLKANSERLYYSALPLWEALGSRLRRLWRWESKLTSAVSMTLYTFLWWRGLLISSIIFGVIMLVLFLKTYPPKPDILRDILTRQRHRDESDKNEARSSVVASSLTSRRAQSEPRSKYSLSAEASRNYGLQASMIAGAVADGHERAKNFALWRASGATWRLLVWLTVVFFVSLAIKPVHLMRVPGAVLGLLFFFLAPVKKYKPHWLGTERSNPFDFVFAGVPNDAQYSMEILRQRARQNKPLVGDPALLLRTDLPGNDSPATSAGNEGRTDWMQWADVFLREKAMAIHGIDVLSGSRSLALTSFPVSAEEPETGRESVFLSEMSRGMNTGIQAFEDKSKAVAASQETPTLGQTLGVNGAEDLVDVDGTFWAVYDGCCGHLVITPHAVIFRSLFARRPRGRRGMVLGAQALMKVAGDTDDQPLVDARTGKLTLPESELADSLPKVKLLLECKLEHIRGIKKLSAFGAGGLQAGSSWSLAAGEGLKIVLKGRRGEVDFWQVRKRDEAFNRLLALTPQQWTRIA